MTSLRLTVRVDERLVLLLTCCNILDNFNAQLRFTKYNRTKRIAVYYSKLADKRFGDVKNVENQFLNRIPVYMDNQQYSM